MMLTPYFCSSHLPLMRFKASHYLATCDVNGTQVSYSLSTMIKEDPRWPKGTGTPLDGNNFNPDR